MSPAFEWFQEGGGKFYDLFKSRATELGSMGITAAWLPPPTKASSQDGNGYDIYDLYDLGEFDAKGGVRTKWGTKEQLLAAVKEAKDHGIICYVGKCYLVVDSSARMRF